MTCSWMTLLQGEEYVCSTYAILGLVGIFYNVFRTRPIIELKKLVVHGLVVRSVVEPQLNQWRHKYIIYILLKLKII